MEIKGQLGEYIVKWSSFGWTGSKVYVYIPSKTFFGLIPSNKCVWDSIQLCSPDSIKKMLPGQLEQLFNEVVKEYEVFKTAWDKEKKLNNKS